jgi:methionine-rich copper-binding protein CopC
MKTQLTLLILILSVVFYYSFQFGEEGTYSSFHNYRNYNTGGPSGGLTGAPGESSCVNCHGGSVQDGSSINRIELVNGQNEFIAGSPNIMRLAFDEAGSKNGFQLTVLDENNEMAGSFNITETSSTQLRNNSVNTSMRQYVTHRSGGTSLSEWEFEWTPPAGLSEATFYVSTNKSNANSSTSGDIIYLSSHSFQSNGNDETANIDENKLNTLHSIAYISSKNALRLSFNEFNKTKNVAVNLLNLSGQSVHFQRVIQLEPGAENEIIPLPNSLQNGIYSVTVFVENDPYTKKIAIFK